MAYIAIVNGGALPVFAIDVRNGYLNTSPTNSTYPQVYFGNTAGAGLDTPIPCTNIAGPKLDFFKILFNKASGGVGTPTAAGGDLSLSAGAGEAASLLLQTIQLRGTVAFYSITQVTANASAYMSVAVYPTGAFNTMEDGTDDSSTTLTALINALGIQTFQDTTVFDFTTATGGLVVSQPGFDLV